MDIHIRKELNNAWLHEEQQALQIGTFSSLTFSLHELLDIFFPRTWVWLSQIHSVKVVVADQVVFSISSHINNLKRKQNKRCFYLKHFWDWNSYTHHKKPLKLISFFLSCLISRISFEILALIFKNHFVCQLTSLTSEMVQQKSVCSVIRRSQVMMVHRKEKLGPEIHLKSISQSTPVLCTDHLLLSKRTEFASRPCPYLITIILNS